MYGSQEKNWQTATSYGQGFSVYPKVPKEEKSSHCLLEEEDLKTPKKARNDLDVP